MDSDDKDAKEVRKNPGIVRREVSRLEREMKKEMSSTDSAENLRPSGVGVAYSQKSVKVLPPPNIDLVHINQNGSEVIELQSSWCMNSVVQCLVHIAPLYEAISSGNHALTCDCAHLKGPCFSCSFRHIFERSTRITFETWTCGVLIVPKDLISALVPEISDEFPKGQQDDGPEFLKMLQDRLKIWHDKDSKYACIIKRVFRGIAVIKHSCNGCDHPSCWTEDIYDVQLPINDENNLIEALLSDEGVDVGYSCDKCGKEEGAKLSIRFKEFPSIATFRLKTFEIVQKHVSFPLVLNMPLTTQEDWEMGYGRRSGHNKIEYNLFAVIVHEGSTLMKGHYYCFIQISPDEWTRFDENKVSKVEKNEVLSQHACLLLYAKKETEATALSGAKWIEDYAPSEIVDGRSGVYSVVDPSSSSRAPAVSEVDDGWLEVRLAPIEEEEGEEEKNLRILKHVRQRWQMNR